MGYKKMNDDFELQFNKMSLKQNDVLIITVKGQESVELIDKMREVREDDFVKYVQDKGVAVLVVNESISFQMLRKEKNDKVVLYLDVSAMNDVETEKYIELIKENIKQTIPDPVIVPCMSAVSMQLKEENYGN